MDTESEDLLKEFVANSSENLNAIEQTLLGLETNRSSKDVDEIFRAIQSRGQQDFSSLPALNKSAIMLKHYWKK